MDFGVVPDFGAGWWDTHLPLNEGPIFVVDIGADHAHAEVPVPAVPDVHDHLHCGGEFSHDDHGTHVTVGCENDFSITHH